MFLKTRVVGLRQVYVTLFLLFAAAVVVYMCIGGAS